ncbi:30S ribosome-binding factor RbfA [Planctomyces sp. SH-PL62]|uniref:30S ribosome-binding factor RbfA n=1 Tax=Planctomyces sp. SH-PL62 TaxID=1636152 RepID=UPI00078BB3A7|nr:30S ribosome-binding factor RbfA [Planctomyces sp. SH-PL62]AMV37668.1 Ribosome-binding factor A [Planctomyces sp. SH-PL62]
MPSHRSLRIAEAIREVVATAVLFEVADPRIQGVTVLGVEVTQDLRGATVYVTVMGSEADRNQAMKGLRSACGFVQSRVAARLQIRYTPILNFKLDESVKKSVEMGRLIEEAVSADKKPGPQADDLEDDLDDDDEEGDEEEDGDDEAPDGADSPNDDDDDDTQDS